MRSDLLMIVMVVFLCVGGDFSAGQLSFGALKVNDIALKSEGITTLLKTQL